MPKFDPKVIEDLALGYGSLARVGIGLIRELIRGIKGAIDQDHPELTPEQRQAVLTRVLENSGISEDFSRKIAEHAGTTTNPNPGG